MKCFTKSFIIDQEDLNIQDFACIYADVRLELNKVSSTDHPNIIHFIGLCHVSFSFLLEWAPKGDLDQVISEYKSCKTSICPDTVAATLLQVSAYTCMHGWVSDILIHN